MERLGGTGGGSINCRMASKTILNWADAVKLLVADGRGKGLLQ
jgi:hypothetical protein